MLPRTLPAPSPPQPQTWAPCWPVLPGQETGSNWWYLIGTGPCSILSTRKAVLRIRDMLVRIRILRNVPSLANGSRYGSGRPKNMRILRIRILNTGTCASFFKDKKSWRSHKTVGIKVFLFLLDDGRIRIRTCHIRIREAQKHTDPQHCRKQTQVHARGKTATRTNLGLLSSPIQFNNDKFTQEIRYRKSNTIRKVIVYI